MRKVKAIPDGMHSVTPHLICAGVADAIWGDRYCKLEDAFGHHWSVATHMRDVSPDDMRQAMQRMGG